EQYIDDPGSASTHYVYSVVKLASKRGSNQIGLIGSDLTNTHVNAWIWDGTTWGNFVAIATTSVGPVDRDNADLAWESGSGNLLAVAASNSATIVSREYSSSWGALPPTISHTARSRPRIPGGRLPRWRWARPTIHGFRPERIPSRAARSRSSAPPARIPPRASGASNGTGRRSP